MKVNILGTEYAIFTESADIPEMEGKAGYCSFDSKEIHILDLNTHEEWKNETEVAKKSYANRTMRHEITHAFLYESGLAQDSSDVEGWAMNEEMVDWIAIQFPKMLKAFEEVGAL